MAHQVDQPLAALIVDLKRRGLLDETLIVVMGAGFAAGAGAAGVTTLGVNHLTGEALTDGLLENSLAGGAIGMSVAGLPASWSSASAITQTGSGTQTSSVQPG